MYVGIWNVSHIISTMLQDNQIVTTVVWLCSITITLSFTPESQHHVPSRLKASRFDDYDIPRRAFLGSVAGIPAAAFTTLSDSAYALDQQIIDCLQDLPPKSPNTVRLYLCRHGQTENNRLHMVQGSRIDPPLNTNGILMANRLGETLRRTIPQSLSRIYHSPLLRAQQTAECIRSQSHIPNYLIQPLPTLAEVDFGPSAEGQPEPRLHALETYLEWSRGNIDIRPAPDGESCRDIWTRCASALTTMASTNMGANSQSQHIVAVSHSAYIRMMLALLQGVEESTNNHLGATGNQLGLSSLVTAATERQNNANINVVDIDRTAPMQSISELDFFTPTPSLPKFSIVLPKTKILRVNEICHLQGIPTA
jgi:broad specificity phosphatase PhoE